MARKFPSIEPISQERREPCLLALEVIFGRLISCLNGDARHDAAVVHAFAAEFGMPVEDVKARINSYIFPPSALVH
jgi:hypothetical protein